MIHVGLPVLEAGCWLVYLPGPLKALMLPVRCALLQIVPRGYNSPFFGGLTYCSHGGDHIPFSKSEDKHVLEANDLAIERSPPSKPPVMVINCKASAVMV